MDRTEAPYSGSTTACRIFIERRAFSKVGRADRHNAGPVSLPFSNRLSLYNHYRSSISCNSCIVLRHTFLSFSSSLSPFVKISLKFYSIGDELFFHASRKLQASFYYSKIGLAWIICWPGPETTSVCTTECLCVAHSFFSVYRNSRPLSWATSVVSQVLPTLSVSRSLSLWVVYTHTHIALPRASSSSSSRTAVSCRRALHDPRGENVYAFILPRAINLAILSSSREIVRRRFSVSLFIY